MSFASVALNSSALGGTGGTGGAMVGASGPAWNRDGSKPRLKLKSCPKGIVWRPVRCYVISAGKILRKLEERTNTKWLRGDEEMPDKMTDGYKLQPVNRLLYVLGEGR